MSSLKFLSVNNVFRPIGFALTLDWKMFYYCMIDITCSIIRRARNIINLTQISIKAIEDTINFEYI